MKFFWIFLVDFEDWTKNESIMSGFTVSDFSNAFSKKMTKKCFISCSNLLIWMIQNLKHCQQLPQIVNFFPMHHTNYTLSMLKRFNVYFTNVIMVWMRMHIETATLLNHNIPFYCSHKHICCVVPNKNLTVACSSNDDYDEVVDRKSDLQSNRSRHTYIESTVLISKLI